MDALVAIAITISSGFILRVIYTQYFHPLAKFPGPWYATSFSIVGALISMKKKEPEFLMYLTRKYGDHSYLIGRHCIGAQHSADAPQALFRTRPLQGYSICLTRLVSHPIRIAPNLLMFPQPSAIKDIYWDPKCNQKSRLYGTGALGPPHLFSTLDGEEHKQLRKALSNAPWTIGQLKNTWEYRFDDQVKLFIQKMKEHAAANRIVCISDKVAEFAADIMSMISFTNSFGCVLNQRDEKDILSNWRKGLNYFSVVSRFEFLRDRVLKIPIIGLWFLPATSNTSGMGWLMCEADRQVTEREISTAEKQFDGHPDFMQHCLDARYSDGSPLTPMQKRAHVTLLIQAGADTTGTALGSTLRFLIANPASLMRARQEIDIADKAGLLSKPIQYEETRQHLPYFVSCIKESLRLNPPATNLFGRIIPQGGKVIDGNFIPGDTEVTLHAYTVQRNVEFYGEDAEEYRPERWLESEKKVFEYEAAQFTFSAGPRVCIGKDIAIMEMYKLLPEIVRHFDFKLKDPGRYVVVGGVAYNQDFLGEFIDREVATKA